MTRSAKDFTDRFGRRVLTDGGQPGRDGNEGSGSTTEEMQGRVAAAIYANCERLDDAQLDEIIGWIAAYKTAPTEPGSTAARAFELESKAVVVSALAHLVRQEGPAAPACLGDEEIPRLQAYMAARRREAADSDDAYRVAMSELTFFETSIQRGHLRPVRALLAEWANSSPAPRGAGAVAANESTGELDGAAIARLYGEPFFRAPAGEQLLDEPSPELELAWQVEGARDQGMSDARAGVQEVSAGFGDLPFDGCPDSWGEKPFARIVWYYDSGDASVGEPSQAGWTLAGDQAGTVVAELAQLDEVDLQLRTELDRIADELEAHPGYLGDGHPLENLARERDFSAERGTRALITALAYRARAAAGLQPGDYNTSEV